MGCSASSLLSRSAVAASNTVSPEVASSKTAKRELVTAIETALQWKIAIGRWIDAIEKSGQAAAMWAEDEKDVIYTSVFRQISVQMAELSIIPRPLLSSITEHLSLLNDILALQREHHDAIKQVSKAQKQFNMALSQIELARQKMATVSSKNRKSLAAVSPTGISPTALQPKQRLFITDRQISPIISNSPTVSTSSFHNLSTSRSSPNIMSATNNSNYNSNGWPTLGDSPGTSGYSNMSLTDISPTCAADIARAQVMHQDALASASATWKRLYRAQTELLNPSILKILSVLSDTWRELSKLFARIKMTCVENNWAPGDEYFQGQSNSSAGGAGGFLTLPGRRSAAGSRRGSMSAVNATLSAKSQDAPQYHEKRVKLLKKWDIRAANALCCWTDLAQFEAIQVKALFEWRRRCMNYGTEVETDGGGGIGIVLINSSDIGQMNDSDQSTRIFESWIGLFKQLDQQDELLGGGGGSSNGAGGDGVDGDAGTAPMAAVNKNYNMSKAIRKIQVAFGDLSQNVKELISREQDILKQSQDLTVFARKAASSNSTRGAKAAKAVHMLDVARYRLEMTLADNRTFRRTNVTKLQVETWGKLESCSKYMATQYRGVFKIHTVAAAAVTADPGGGSGIASRPPLLPPSYDLILQHPLSQSTSVGGAINTASKSSLLQPNSTSSFKKRQLSVQENALEKLENFSLPIASLSSSPSSSHRPQVIQGNITSDDTNSLGPSSTLQRHQSVQRDASIISKNTAKEDGETSPRQRRNLSFQESDKPGQNISPPSSTNQMRPSTQGNLTGNDGLHSPIKPLLSSIHQRQLTGNGNLDGTMNGSPPSSTHQRRPSVISQSSAKEDYQSRSRRPSLQPPSSPGQERDLAHSMAVAATAAAATVAPTSGNLVNSNGQSIGSVAESVEEFSQITPQSSPAKLTQPHHRTDIEPLISSSQEQPIFTPTRNSWSPQVPELSPVALRNTQNPAVMKIQSEADILHSTMQPRSLLLPSQPQTLLHQQPPASENQLSTTSNHQVLHADGVAPTSDNVAPPTTRMASNSKIKTPAPPPPETPPVLTPRNSGRPSSSISPTTTFTPSAPPLDNQGDATIAAAGKRINPLMTQENSNKQSPALISRASNINGSTAVASTPALVGARKPSSNVTADSRGGKAPSSSQLPTSSSSRSDSRTSITATSDKEDVMRSSIASDNAEVARNSAAYGGGAVNMANRNFVAPDSPQGLPLSSPSSSSIGSNSAPYYNQQNYNHQYRPNTNVVPPSSPSSAVYRNAPIPSAPPAHQYPMMPTPPASQYNAPQVPRHRIVNRDLLARVAAVETVHEGESGWPSNSAEGDMNNAMYNEGNQTRQRRLSNRSIQQQQYQQYMQQQQLLQQQQYQQYQEFLQFQHQQQMQPQQEQYQQYQYAPLSEQQHYQQNMQYQRQQFQQPQQQPSPQQQYRNYDYSSSSRRSVNTSTSSATSTLSNPLYANETPRNSSTPKRGSVALLSLAANQDPATARSVAASSGTGGSSARRPVSAQGGVRQPPPPPPPAPVQGGNRRGV